MQRLKKGKWSAFIRKINFCVYAINITELIYSRKFNYVIIQLYLRYLLQWIISFISSWFSSWFTFIFSNIFFSANYLSLNPSIPTVHCCPSSPFSLFPTLPRPHPLPPPFSLFPLSFPSQLLVSFSAGGVRTNVTKYRKDLLSRALNTKLLENSQRLNAFAQFQTNKGGKFLKKTPKLRR